MKFARLILLTVLVLAVTLSVGAAPIKIAAWNIEHLRDEDGEGPNNRSKEDYERLARYAAELDADILALQEVEGPEAAARILDPNEYRFFFSSRDNPMRTGFAVRKGFEVKQNPDYEALDVTGGLRYGTDITVTVDGQSLRLLSVHLKSGCHGGSLDSSDRDCVKLKRQLPVLEEWIDARATEEIQKEVASSYSSFLGR